MVPWGPMRRTIGEIAAFVTSKNAGPFLLTLDIVFPDRATYERLRSSVDECAKSFVTDATTFESVEASPYVVAGQGPWGATFKDNIRVALTEAAGTGD